MNFSKNKFFRRLLDDLTNYIDNIKNASYGD